MPRNPTSEEYQLYLEKIHLYHEFSAAVIHDLGRSIDLLNQDPYTIRSMVRCFGTFADGHAGFLKKIAIATCELYGKSLNPFLLDKAEERGISTCHRIQTIYRILREFLPESPLSRIPDERWDALKQAIQIRNRVVHPSCVADLEVTTEQIHLVIKIATAFMNDASALHHWTARFIETELNGRRSKPIRLLSKAGRNEPCPCNSGRKYKNCCGKLG